MNSIATIVGLILALSGATAFAIVYTKSNVTKRTIEQLQELADALDKRVAALESEREDLQGRINHLESENEVLRSLVTGEPQAEEVKALLQSYHSEVMEALEIIKQKG